MNSRTADTLTDTLFRAARAGLLFDGQLLSARASEAASCTSRKNDWRFCSRVPDSALEMFRSTPEACVVTSDVLGLSDACAYWVIGYQAGPLQHRFLLPLAGADVEEMCRDIGADEVGLEMTSLRGGDALLSRVPVSQQVDAALKQRCARSWSVDAVLQEMLVVSAGLLEPSALRPAPGVIAPICVSVTGVLPASLALEFKSAGESPRPEKRAQAGDRTR